jgi:MFS family permease
MGMRRFYGWRVVWATFVLAMFGWGVGFYGPPVYLHAVRATRGWSLPTVSTAVTVHFLVGALVVANLPKLYRRFGVPAVTKAGAVSLALGVVGWAVAMAPWQLFAATLLSGAGWVGMGAAAVNAIIAPWFARTRPAALAMAYNGASIGGVVFSPLWVAAIGALGFAWAGAVIGVVMVITIWILADIYFVKAPTQMGLLPDGTRRGRGRQA